MTRQRYPGTVLTVHWELGKGENMTTSRKLRNAALATMMAIMAAAVALGGCSKGTRTHVYATPDAYREPVVVTPTAQAQVQPLPRFQAQPGLSNEQLDELLAPIALYPDSLLAEVLPACTYPAEVAWAWQWRQANPASGDAAIEALNLEPSVKAVAHYPDVLQMLAEHAEWTQVIGAAFLTQQDDVLMSIQRLRTMAIEAQTLRSTPQQQVIVADNYVEILPASPEVIYVPLYDPVIVYVRRPQPAPVIFFSVRFTSGRWLGNCLDWRRRRVEVGSGWHPQWRYEQNQWRPIDRDVVFTRGPTISRATRPAVVAARPTAQQWSHNPAKPQPRLPAAQMVRRPGPPGQRVEPMVDIRPTRPAGDQRHPAPNQITPPRATPPKVEAPRPAAPPTMRLPVAKPTTPPRQIPPAARPTPPAPKPTPKPTTPPEVVTPRPIAPPTPPATRPTPTPRPIPKPITPPEVVTPKPITPPTPPATRPTPERRPIPKPITPPEVVSPKPITPPTPPATRPTPTPERRPIPKPITPPEVVTPKPIAPPTPPATRPTPTPERRPIPKPTTPPEVVTPKPITPPTPPATRPTRTTAAPTRKPGPDSNSAKS